MFFKSAYVIFIIPKLTQCTLGLSLILLCMVKFILTALWLGTAYSSDFSEYFIWSF